jgi:hypothetical protein
MHGSCQQLTPKTTSILILSDAAAASHSRGTEDDVAESNYPLLRMSIGHTEWMEGKYQAEELQPIVTYNFPRSVGEEEVLR